MRNANKNSDIARISSCLEKSNRNFFRQWLEFTKPVHKLAQKEIEILAHFLQIRYEYSKSVQDPNILDSLLMSVETKRLVRELCDISPGYFQVVMTKFKKQRIVIDNKINPRYIPNVEEDSEGYKLVLFFDFRNNGEGQSTPGNI